MGHDSITNFSIQTAASSAKDFCKKKRANRTAKLKQTKLDVRREHWLSQMKNKGCKEEINRDGGVKMPAPDVHAQNHNLPTMKLDINPGGDHCSDSDSPPNSPISHTSSLLCSTGSVSNFSGSSCRSNTSSITEEDDNGCLDDWEAIADTLAATDIKTSNLESPPEPQPIVAQAWRPNDVFHPQSLPNLLKQNSFVMNSEGRCGPSGFTNLDSSLFV